MDKVTHLRRVGWTCIVPWEGPQLGDVYRIVQGSWEDKHTHIKIELPGTDSSWGVMRSLYEPLIQPDEDVYY